MARFGKEIIEPEGWIQLALDQGFAPIFGLHIWNRIASIPGMSALDIPKYTKTELTKCSERLAQTAARNGHYGYLELKKMWNKRCHEAEDMECPSFEDFIWQYEPDD